MSEVPKLERFNKKDRSPEMPNFFKYIVLKNEVFQAHRRMLPTTGVFLHKWMNIFTGDLLSMYVVLQGIGSLSCIRVYNILYIIYVIRFWE